ncbi:MAG: hypothetical protein K0Q53_2138 [Massilibacillus sp.]|jgi:hypothetical protein|nr:hypothetical protein [Massilibacillus sp.]
MFESNNMLSDKYDYIMIKLWLHFDYLLITKLPSYMQTVNSYFSIF